MIHCTLTQNNAQDDNDDTLAINQAGIWLWKRRKSVDHCSDTKTFLFKMHDRLDLLKRMVRDVLFCSPIRFVPFWSLNNSRPIQFELIYSFTVQFLYKSNSVNWIKLTSINIQICRFHHLNIQSRSLRHHEILATRAQFTWLAQRGPIEFSWFLNDPLPLVPPCFPHAMNYETGNSIHCQSENVGTLMTIWGPRSFRKEIHYERINHGHELLPRRFAPMCKTDAA